MNNLIIYCVTNKESKLLETLPFKLAGVGKKKFSSKYINCNSKKNIQKKEKYYSELTFHYWFWKNQLNLKDNNTWFGFCQKRRFWLNSKSVSENDDILNVILQSIPKEWNNYEAVICEPIYLGTKLSKLIKRGWKNILNKPSLLFNHSEINIKLQFDMHHGYNVLDRAIDVMDEKDREDFRNFVNTKNLYNPHIMFISKKKYLINFLKINLIGFLNVKKYLVLII